jgi:uncharacterized RDD family membrane protein YckC
MSTDIPVTIEPPPPSVALLPGSVVGGVWRRLFAFLLDAFLLGIVGAIAGAAFFETLVRMGPLARVVGFCIALCYFGLFDSSVGGGQSIGKRFLRLKVVDAQGRMLSLEESILRFIVFGVPFFANGLPLPISRTPWIVLALLGVVVFGGGATNLYLLIFNRPMRQGLHDLTVNSYVVMNESEGPVVSGPFWKPHWVIIGALVVLLGGVPSLIVPFLLRKGTFAQLMTDVTLVERIDGVQSAAVNKARVVHSGDPSSATLLSIDIRWTGETGNEEQIADQVAKVIIQNDHSIQNYTRMRVAITRGYDLGIGSRWTSRAFAYSPDEWRLRVQ